MQADGSQVAVRVLALAAALGLICEALLREGPWGVNAPLAALTLPVGVRLLWRSGAERRPGVERWLWAAPLLATILVWRASPPLVLLTVVGVFGTLVAASLAAHGRTLSVATPWQLLVEGAATVLHAGLGSAILVARLGGSEAPRRGTRPAALLRGLALAVPLLVVFGALFVDADAAFAGLVADVVHVDFEVLVSHVLLAVLFTVLAAGYLRWLVLDDGARVPGSEAVPVRLGAVEVTTALGATAALFAVFVAVQFTVLFGGAARVLSTAGLTYAEYARSGFFQLVAVSVLVLPLLAISHWVVREADAGGRRAVRWISAGLIVLVYVILASALFRMRLYQQAYGLTLPRLYTMAFIAWLALVFLGFAATILRDRSRGFAGGAVAAAYVALFALAVVNPEARVVQVNAERALTGASLDGAYLARDLGPDAVPSLVATLPVLLAGERCVIAERLLHRWSGPDEDGPDWRGWSWARSRARSVVGEHRAELERVACEPVPPT